MPIKQLFVFLACACVAVLPAGHASAGEQSINAHSFTLPSPDDEPIDLAQYKGKVVMVVNTASQCSFTKQYGPLQKLQAEYGDRGL